MTSYAKFLQAKSHSDDYGGFDPVWMPPALFDFQQHLTDWAIRKGKAAIFADCGLGKTPMQLVWAENVVRKTNKPVLIVTPLAVSAQTIREGEKFGVECKRSSDGKIAGKITVTNYERLDKFNAEDFAGVVCDESSILKNFDGVRRAIVTEFLRTRPYRLLCTATAAPNDYIELGTTSEALGQLGYMDMLGRFFKNDQNTIKPMVYRQHGKSFAQLDERAKWRFKKHAELPFWRWVCSWARALRRPSDLGYDDTNFVLPELRERQTVIENQRLLPGELFPKVAVGLKDQRAERRITLRDRCELVADLVNHKKPALVWCHLNQEGDLLNDLIKDGEQVSGDDPDERKEELFLAFASGQLRVLITKPKIGAWGLNFQHCSHVTFFPSHSFEQYYQGVRRCWRFGQKNPVIADTVTTSGEMDVLRNLQRKAEAADKMYSELVAQMQNSLEIDKRVQFKKKEIIPEWL